MPKSPIITEPVENIASLQSKMDALNEHLKDKRELSVLLKKPLENEDALQFLRFLASFQVTTQGAIKKLHLYSNNEFGLGGVQHVAKSTQQYINLPLSAFPDYLFELINYLDSLENSSKKTLLPSEQEITVEEFIRLIDTLDERLAAHQPTEEEGCMFLKISSSDTTSKLSDQSTQIDTLREVSKNIPTNAAYIRDNYSELYYVNKEKNIYTNVPIFPQDRKAIDSIHAGMRSDLPGKLSLVHLAQFYAHTGHHHIDTIDRIKENFSAFKRTVLPYLEARKMLVNAEIDTSPAFLPLDYEANKTTFAKSISTVSENLTQLKSNPERLEKVKVALEQEEAERVAAEKRKQEEAQRLKEEKRKQKEAERLQEEKRKQEEAEKIEEEKRKQEEEKKIEEEKRKQEEAQRLEEQKRKQEEIKQAQKEREQEKQKKEFEQKVTTTKTELLSKRTTTEKFIDWLQDHPKTTFGLSILGLILLLIPGIVIMAMYFGAKNSTRSIDKVISALEKGKDPANTAIEDLPSSTMKEVAKKAIQDIFPESTQNAQGQSVRLDQPFKSPLQKITAVTNQPLPSSSASAVSETPKNG